jgi:hypothetical protein
MLIAVLSPRGVRARIGQLLRHSGYSVRFNAPWSGKLVIDWYYIHRVHSRHGTRTTQVRVAAVTAHIKKAGPVEVKIKLTPRGRLLLRHARRQRLTAKASFTPAGQPTTRMSKVIHLIR